MSRRVVVLGAAGYLGRHVTQAARLQGHQVTAITRSMPAARNDASLSVCDAADRSALFHIAAGADCVVNAIRADPDTMVLVTSHLRGLLHRDAVGQLLHVSSLAVYGQTSGVVHEGIVPVPLWGDRHAQALLQAEMLIAQDDRLGARVVVFRPGCIYGPGAPVWVDGILRLLRARRLGWLGRSGDGACLLIHVQDLARAITQTMGHGVSGTYHVVAPDLLSWNDYFFRMAALIGALPLRRIGVAGLAAETWLGAARQSLAGRRGTEMMDAVTPAMARVFRNRARIVSVRAPLLEASTFRSLRDGSAEAAEAFLRHDTQRESVRRRPALATSQAAS
jgi:nucleoside-diphosphate-sugar epimerase